MKLVMTQSELGLFKKEKEESPMKIFWSIDQGREEKRREEKRREEKRREEKRREEKRREEKRREREE